MLLRILLLISAAAAISAAAPPPVWAQSKTRTEDACKQCRQHYDRCMKNYPGQTCKTERDICLKTCRKK